MVWNMGIFDFLKKPKKKKEDLKPQPEEKK